MNNFIKFIMNYTPAIALTALLVGVSAFGLAISNSQDEMFGAVLTSNMTGSTSLAVLNAKFDALDALDATIPGDTDDLDEGSTNLYYTLDRVNGRIYAVVGATTSLPNLNITESQISDLGSYLIASDVYGIVGATTSLPNLNITESQISDLGSYITDGNTGWDNTYGLISTSSLFSLSGLTDEYCLTYEETGGTMVWQTCGTGGGSVTGSQGQIAYLSDTDTAIGTSTIYITPDGRIIAGKTGATSVVNTGGDGFILMSENGTYSDFGNYGFGNITPTFFAGRANGTYSSPTTALNNDVIGQLSFQGYNGSSFVNGANIRGKINGTPGPANMPAKLEFYASNTLAMTLDVDGSLTVVGDVTGNNLNISNWNTAYGWGDHASAGYNLQAFASSTYAIAGGAYHDGFSDFVANEHIDWTTDQGATNIDAGNYTDTNTTYTAGDALTLTGTDFDFDGGASPAGALGGTWASPTVDSDGAWTEHDSYPSACSAGDVVTAIGDTLTCETMLLEKCFTIATTSMATFEDSIIWSPESAITVSKERCRVVGGTSQVMNISDGSSDMDSITCTTSLTEDASLSNNTWSADEAIYIEFGATTGNVTTVNYCILYTYD